MEGIQHMFASLCFFMRQGLGLIFYREGTKALVLSADHEEEEE